MSFIGRIIAGARDLSFGGPLGNLLAGAARLIPSWLPPHGHGEDANGDPRRRIAFTIAVIALGAKMAKADGAVTRDEVAAFGEVFQVPPGEEEHVRLVFDLARKSTTGFESYARQVGRLFADDRAVLEDLLGGLTVGKAVSVMRNGADGAIKAVITELRPLGTFATWQAERVIGDHDRNTLRLRLDPEGEPVGLEPGMTVWIEH